MKLKNCLDIGKDCGLDTLGEAVYNVDLHAGNIFEYSKINEELRELKSEMIDLFNSSNFTVDSAIDEVLKHLEVTL